MDDRSRDREVTRDVVPGDSRALRKLGDASSAFNASPSSTLTPSGSWALEGVVGLRPRLSPSRNLQPTRVPPIPVRRLEVRPHPPVGPPYLLAMPLYDGRDDDLHEIFDRLSPTLDKATGENVLIELVANPAEVNAVYASLRSGSLAKLDAARTAVYLRKIRQGQGARHIRHVEVHKLIEYLGVSPDKLPCIAFLPFPMSLPLGIFSIKPEWLSTQDERRRFAAAIVEFFDSVCDVPALLTQVSTNVDLVKAFEKQLNEWFVERLTAVPAARLTTDVRPDPEAWYTPKRLAELFGVRQESLRQRLNRYQIRNDACWKENEDRGPRESKSLYLLREVQHVIDGLLATSERPAK